MNEQTDGGKLVELAETLLRGSGSDNALDVLVEVALFEPDETAVSVRANNAGTKVIYTGPDGKDATCWAGDWTCERINTAARLRARAALRATDPRP